MRFLWKLETYRSARIEGIRKVLSKRISLGEFVDIFHIRNGPREECVRQEADEYLCMRESYRSHKALTNNRFHCYFVRQLM